MVFASFNFYGSKDIYKIIKLNSLLNKIKQTNFNFSLIVLSYEIYIVVNDSFMHTLFQYYIQYQRVFTPPISQGIPSYTFCLLTHTREALFYRPTLISQLSNPQSNVFVCAYVYVKLTSFS